MDSTGWSEVYTAALGGSLMVIAGLYVWPTAAAAGRSQQRANAGLALGVAATLVTGALRALLCEGTPYCLVGIPAKVLLGMPADDMRV